MGAIALAPSRPDVLYVGTGEPVGSSSQVQGIGILKSVDGGATWQFPATVMANSFFRLSVHPSNADVVLAGSGSGLFLTRDGGATWQTVLELSVGDIVRDPADADTIYVTARGYQSVPVWRSADGGLTWEKRSAGLPDAPYDRFAIATSVTGHVMYVAGKTNGASRIFRTDDRGASWHEVGAPSDYLESQSAYDNVITVSPIDANVVIAGGVGYVRSGDGGTTWKRVMEGVHVDAHDLAWQGPLLFIANDGGVWASGDAGATATPRSDGLVTAQFYALARAEADPSAILGGTQDNGSLLRSRNAAEDWSRAPGGDVFSAYVDDVFPEQMYAMSQYGDLYRVDAESGSGRNIQVPTAPGEKFSFGARLLARRDDPRILYTATLDRPWRSTDAGFTWMPLSTQTIDGVPFGSYVRVLAVIPSKPEVLFLDTYEHGLYRSADGGKTWQSLSLPYVQAMAVSADDPSVLYAASGDGKVLVSTDGGISWSRRGSGLPVVNVHSLAIDPLRSGVVYCGTDVGIYESIDSGQTWRQWLTTVPAVDVRSITINGDGSQISIGTHGRGVWECERARATTPPEVTIHDVPSMVMKGETLRLNGSVASSTGTATAMWFFSDSDEPVSHGNQSMSHVFARAGEVEVALVARDNGATAAARKRFTVQELFGACSMAWPIPSSSRTISIRTDFLAAQTELVAPQRSCDTGTRRSLWFQFTPAQTGQYQIDVDTALYSAIVTVWRGEDCAGLVELGCSFGEAVNGEGVHVETRATYTLDSRESYRIEVTPITESSPSFQRSQPVTVTFRAASSKAPTLTVAAPLWLSTNGGTPVVVNGTGFEAGATASIGGVAAPVDVLSPNVIVLTAPRHAPGPVDITITTSAGVGSLFHTVTYVGEGSKRRSVRH